MKLRILGAGGHAKVAIEAWRSRDGEVIALHDDRAGLDGQCVLGIPVEGSLDAGLASADLLHIAIGDNVARARIAADQVDARFPQIVQDLARVSPTARIGAGTLICAGAVVQPDAEVGRHAIINTLALIEHDCVIGDFCHVAPGVRLGGGVHVDRGALVGIGATVLPGTRIGSEAVIGAGAVVVRDVAAGDVVVGNPAAPLERPG